MTKFHGELVSKFSDCSIKREPCLYDDKTGKFDILPIPVREIVLEEQTVEFRHGNDNDKRRHCDPREEIDVCQVCHSYTIKDGICQNPNCGCGE